MHAQQLIALLIVAVAAVYLGRNLVRSARAFFSKQGGGCATGCGKCGFAPRENPTATSGSPPARPNIIPLGDIRSVPKK